VLLQKYAIGVAEKGADGCLGCGALILRAYAYQLFAATIGHHGSGSVVGYYQATYCGILRRHGCR
jgi:hypothetical protein